MAGVISSYASDGSSFVDFPTRSIQNFIDAISNALGKCLGNVTPHREVLVNGYLAIHMPVKMAHTDKRLFDVCSRVAS